MVTLTDQYVPIEGINFSFTEIENCELEARPSRIGFKGKDYWFRKRDGIITDELWGTKGNLKASAFFNQKIYSYTDDGFVYNFDGQAMESISAVPAASISQATGNTDLDIDATPTTRQGQEFTTTQDGVIRSITVRMKSVGTLPTGVFTRCKITTAADKNTVVATSQTIFSGIFITGSYADFTFQFNNFYTTNATQYFFYIEADGIDATDYIQIEGQTGNPYAGGASYNYDGSVWAVNGTTDLRFSVDITGRLFYDSRFSEDTTIVSYLGGGRYPNATVSRTVSSYNNTTGAITVGSALPGAVGDFIGKYVYVSAGGAAIRQYGFITDQSSSTVITVAALFPVDLAAADTVIFYNSLEPQVLMPQLRRGSGGSDVPFLYSISRSGQSQFRHYPVSKKLVYWDNRLVSLKLDGQGIIFTDFQQLEIPSTLTINFGNEEALDVSAFGSYLMCFFKNKIGIVRKIINPSTNAIAYVYQDLVSTGIYSAKSYLIKASDLYVFSSDKRLYSVDISTLTINELSADLKDQGDVLENYFDKFEEGGEVSFNFSSGILRLIYKFNGATEVYKYIDGYQVWVRDTYSFAGNFMNRLYNINDEKASCYNDKFVIFGGIKDLDQNISQRIKIYGPDEGKMSTFTLLKTKLRIGFDYENKIGGRVKLQIGGYKLVNRFYDLKDIDVIQEINSVIDSKGLIGESQIAQFTIGGELYSQEQLKGIYPEIIDVGFNVGRKGQYFTMEVTNDEEKQLYLNVINPLYNTESPLVINNKGVIPGT